MVSSWQIRTLVAAALCLGVAASAAAQGGQRVNFDTADGVSLEGTYYPSMQGKKATCVLLLHNFQLGKGGSRADAGWDTLAAALQKKGYAVLAFDFRGHGGSTSVSDNFWDRRAHPHNTLLPGAKMAKPPRTIAAQGMPASYYP